MIKKISALTVAVSLLTSAFVFAADSVLEKTNAMEQTIYGHIQEGAMVDRVGQIELTLSGQETHGDLGKTVDALYKAVEPSGATTSLKTKVDMMEWTYSGALSKGSLLDRVSTLERAVKGRVATGPLETRIENLEKVVIGENKKIVLQPATISKTNVFKITLDEPISTQKNSVGDTFSFTVAEDIVDGNLLVVPEGVKGIGTITKLSKARSFGRNGEIDISFISIPTVGGVLFNAEQGQEAKEKSQEELKAAGTSVAGVALLGPIGLVGGYFIKGKAIEYPVGQALYVQPVATIDTYGAGLEEVTNSEAKTTAPVKSANGQEKSAAKAKVEAEKVAAKAKEAVDKAKAEAEAKAKEEARKKAEESTSIAPSEAVVVIKKAE